MWFITALIVGGLIAWLAMWLRSRNINVSWYAWLIGITGVALLLLAFQNFAGSNAEFESQAANMSLLALGIPALILLAVAGQFIWRSNKSSG